jgi:sulfur-carrier protein
MRVDLLPVVRHFMMDGSRRPQSIVIGFEESVSSALRSELPMECTVPQIRVAIPQELRSLCGGEAPREMGELCVAARDVRQALRELARLHPQVHNRLCDERGEPRPHINVFVNDDHVRARDGLNTALTSGDLVSILPAVSGG